MYFKVCRAIPYVQWDKRRVKLLMDWMFERFDADLEFDADKENMTQEQYESRLALSQKELSDGEKVYY